MGITERPCVTCNRVTPHEMLLLDASADGTGRVTFQCQRCHPPRHVSTPPPPISRGPDLMLIIAAISGLIMLISAFLPWIAFGDIKLSGVEGANKDGWVVAGFGLIVLLLPLTLINKPQRRAARIIFAILGVLTIVVCGLDIAEVKERIASVDEQFRHLANVGIGLYLGVLGGLGAIISAGIPRN